MDDEEEYDREEEEEKCVSCTRCSSCGSPNVTTWLQVPPRAGQSEFPETKELALCCRCLALRQNGNYCPICNGCYEDDDYESKMMECGRCGEWIHAHCEGLSNERYQILSFLPDSVEYVCRRCLSDGTKGWMDAVDKELTAGCQAVLEALIGSRCAKHLVRKDLKASPPSPLVKGSFPVMAGNDLDDSLNVKDEDPLPSANSSLTNPSLSPPLLHQLDLQPSTIAALSDRKQIFEEEKKCAHQVLPPLTDMQQNECKDFSSPKAYLEETSHLGTSTVTTMEVVESNDSFSPKICPVQAQGIVHSSKSMMDQAQDLDVPLSVAAPSKDESSYRLRKCSVRLEDICKVRSPSASPDAKTQGSHPEGDCDGRMVVGGEALFQEIRGEGNKEDQAASAAAVFSTGKSVEPLASSGMCVGEVETQRVVHLCHAGSLSDTQVDGPSDKSPESSSFLQKLFDDPNNANDCQGNQGWSEVYKQKSNTVVDSLSNCQALQPISPKDKITKDIDDDCVSSEESSYCETDSEIESIQDDPDEPKDLVAVQDRVQESKYKTVLQFHVDVCRIIETGKNLNKCQTRNVKSTYGKHIKECFPWFDVKAANIFELVDKNRPFPPPHRDHTYTVRNVRRVPRIFTKYDSPLGRRGYGTGVEGGLKVDHRKCVLCTMEGDHEPNNAGRLLYLGQDEWIHINCGLWSSEVYEEVDGGLQNVYVAVSRGRQIKCSSCQDRGATVGCCHKTCQATYHFMCAREVRCQFMEDKRIFCPQHENTANGPEKADEFRVNRCVYVDMDSEKKKWKQVLGSRVNVAIGSLTIHSLGRILPESDHEEALIPVDFVCSRLHWSTVDPSRKTRYICRTRRVVPSATALDPNAFHVTIDHSQGEKGVSKCMAEVQKWFKQLEEKKVEKKSRETNIIPPHLCPLYQQILNNLGEQTPLAKPVKKQASPTVVEQEVRQCIDDIIDKVSKSVEEENLLLDTDLPSIVSALDNELISMVLNDLDACDPMALESNLSTSGRPSPLDMDFLNTCDNLEDTSVKEAGSHLPQVDLTSSMLSGIPTSDIGSNLISLPREALECKDPSPPVDTAPLPVNTRSALDHNCGDAVAGGNDCSCSQGNASSSTSCSSPSSTTSSKQICRVLPMPSSQSRRSSNASDLSDTSVAGPTSSPVPASPLQALEEVNEGREADSPNCRRDCKKICMKRNYKTVIKKYPLRSGMRKNQPYETVQIEINETIEIPEEQGSGVMRKNLKRKWSGILNSDEDNSTIGEKDRTNKDTKEESDLCPTTSDSAVEEKAMSKKVLKFTDKTNDITVSIVNNNNLCDFSKSRVHKYKHKTVLQLDGAADGSSSSAEWSESQDEGSQEEARRRRQQQKHEDPQPPLHSALALRIKEQSLARSVPGEEGPYKCSKCKRLYRTRESCQKHVETCTFEVDSSSTSEEEEEEEERVTKTIQNLESGQQQVQVQTKEGSLTTVSTCAQAFSLDQVLTVATATTTPVSCAGHGSADGNSDRSDGIGGSQMSTYQGPDASAQSRGVTSAPSLQQQQQQQQYVSQEEQIQQQYFNRNSQDIPEGQQYLHGSQEQQFLGSLLQGQQTNPSQNSQPQQYLKHSPQPKQQYRNQEPQSEQQQPQQQFHSQDSHHQQFTDHSCQQQQFVDQNQQQYLSQNQQDQYLNQNQQQYIDQGQQQQQLDHSQQQQLDHSQQQQLGQDQQQQLGQDQQQQLDQSQQQQYLDQTQQHYHQQQQYLNQNNQPEHQQPQQQQYVNQNQPLQQQQQYLNQNQQTQEPSTSQQYLSQGQQPQHAPQQQQQYVSQDQHYLSQNPSEPQQYQQQNRGQGQQQQYTSGEELQHQYQLSQQQQQHQPQQPQQHQQQYEQGANTLVPSTSLCEQKGGSSEGGVKGDGVGGSEEPVLKKMRTDGIVGRQHGVHRQVRIGGRKGHSANTGQDVEILKEVAGMQGQGEGAEPFIPPTVSPVKFSPVVKKSSSPRRYGNIRLLRGNKGYQYRRALPQIPQAPFQYQRPPHTGLHVGVTPHLQESNTPVVAGGTSAGQGGVQYIRQTFPSHAGSYAAHVASTQITSPVQMQQQQQHCGTSVAPQVLTVMSAPSVAVPQGYTVQYVGSFREGEATSVTNQVGGGLVTGLSYTPGGVVMPTTPLVVTPQQSSVVVPGMVTPNIAYTLTTPDTVLINQSPVMPSVQPLQYVPQQQQQQQQQHVVAPQQVMYHTEQQLHAHPVGSVVQYSPTVSSSQTLTSAVLSSHQQQPQQQLQQQQQQQQQHSQNLQMQGQSIMTPSQVQVGGPNQQAGVPCNSLDVQSSDVGRVVTSLSPSSTGSRVSPSLPFSLSGSPKTSAPIKYKPQASVAPQPSSQSSPVLTTTCTPEMSKCEGLARLPFHDRDVVVRTVATVAPAVITTSVICSLPSSTTSTTTTSQADNTPKIATVRPRPTYSYRDAMRAAQIQRQKQRQETIQLEHAFLKQDTTLSQPQFEMFDMKEAKPSLMEPRVLQANLSETDSASESDTEEPPTKESSQKEDSLETQSYKLVLKKDSATNTGFNVMPVSGPANPLPAPEVKELRIKAKVSVGPKRKKSKSRDPERDMLYVSKDTTSDLLVNEQLPNFSSGPLLSMPDDPTLFEKPKTSSSEPYIVFEVTSDDGFHVESRHVAEVWQKVFSAVTAARANMKMDSKAYGNLESSGSNTMSGLHMLGLTHNAVQYLLEQLPGAKDCHRYSFQFHRRPQEEETVEENPSGCARTEPFKLRSPYDIFSWLASKHRKMPLRSHVQQEEIQLSIRRATSLELPMAMRYRHLRETAREAVGVFRSLIHGRGLFCKRDIDAGEMVIEYAGQVIRSSLCDMREKYYESKGIGCYMFRIDDDTVIDATMHGNAARFINHSCDPNCYSRVVDILGKKHIIIFALRRILRGEELTYDYKFPIEEDKIPCTCGTRRCRKYLN